MWNISSSNGNANPVAPSPSIETIIRGGGQLGRLRGSTSEVAKSEGIIDKNLVPETDIYDMHE